MRGRRFSGNGRGGEIEGGEWRGEMRIVAGMIRDSIGHGRDWR